MLDMLIHGYLFVVVLFFIGTNVTYTVLLFLSLKEILRYVRHNSFSDFRPTVQSEFVPGVSLLMPAFSEEATIVESVRSLLKISYGRFEVIVVNDGSNDQTLVRMTEQFGLHTSKHVYAPTIETQPVRAIYKSKMPEYANLIVVDKENGGKADALNAGINVARYDLVCAIDADSLLEEDALQRVVKPFLEDGRVIASGGIIRIANGCEVANGRVVKVGLSRNPLPLFQVVEYFRAFLSGRMAWQGMNALLVISGAFGMFRRQVVIDVGGYRTDTVGEDIELVVRMHRIMLERRKPYRIAFVPDPVCWTEVPDQLWILGRQRNRWQRGLVDVMRFHGRMLFNQRYGLVGMAAMPYYLFVEILGPVLELLGYVATVILLIEGSLDMEMAALFFLVALLYGILFSVGAVVLEEISFRRYPSPKHLAILLLMAVVENFGYRQLTAWWRLKAIFDSLRGQRGWGEMPRTGFGTGESSL